MHRHDWKPIGGTVDSYACLCGEVKLGRDHGRVPESEVVHETAGRKPSLDEYDAAATRELKSFLLIDNTGRRYRP